MAMRRYSGAYMGSIPVGSNGWEHHSRPRPVTRAEHTFTIEPIVVHRPTFAVQIAKSPGADVTGVCHTTKVDLVRSLGRRPRHRLHPRRLHPERPKDARRTAIGALFGLHTWRVRIYLQPASGRKPGEQHDAFPSSPDETSAGTAHR